jgi:hypothetical protein
MTDDLISTPTVSLSFVDHERYKKHESFSDANHLSLPFIATKNLIPQKRFIAGSAMP